MIKIMGKSITYKNSIAQTFNNFFTNIDQSLAKNISKAMIPRIFNFIW